MQKKMTDHKKMIADILMTDPACTCTQKQAAAILGVSQSTISSAVKEIEMRKVIYDLSTQLAEARQEIIDRGYIKKYSLPPASDIIDVTPRN